MSEINGSQENKNEYDEFKFRPLAKADTWKKVAYWIWIIAVIIVYVYIPNVGPNALTAYAVKYGGLIILGIVPYVAGIWRVFGISDMYDRGELPELASDSKGKYAEDLDGFDFNEKLDRTMWARKNKILFPSNKTLVWGCVYGAFFVFWGISGINLYLKDVGTEPIKTTLYACTLYRDMGITRRGINTVYLQGWDNGTRLSFDIKGVDLYERGHMARNTGKFEVYYYPNTMVLEKYFFEYDENINTKYKESTALDYKIALEKEGKTVKQYATANNSLQKEGNLENVDYTRDEVLEKLYEKSNLPFVLLSKATPPSDYSNTNRECGKTDDEYCVAFCGHYPMDSEEYVINKFTITGGDYNIHGIHVGDSIMQMSVTLSGAGFGQEYTSKESEIYPKPEGTFENIFVKGDLRIYCYFDPNDKKTAIREIRVSVCNGDGYWLDYEK